MNNETFRKGWQAIIVFLGTTQLFLFADFYLLYEFLIAPFFDKAHRKFHRPAPELIAIAVLIALASLWSPRTNDGLQTAARILILATVLPAYKYGFHYKRIAGLTLAILAIVVAAQSVFMMRPNGIHMNALLLAESAFVFMPIFWYELGLAGAIIMVFSLSRSPVIALMIFAVLSRRRYFMVLSAVTAAMFLIYAAVSVPERISPGGVVRSFVERGKTVTGFDKEKLDTVYGDGRCGEFREVEYKQFGYGFYGYCGSTGQPRPHNIYTLSFYEFGVLFLPFWALIFYAARRLSWMQVLPLLALGAASENLLGRPEGIYLIAAWIISTNLMWNRTPKTNAANTVRN